MVFAPTHPPARLLEQGVEAGEDIQAGGDDFELEFLVLCLADFLGEG